jgi:hypothetical protein
VKCRSGYPFKLCDRTAGVDEQFVMKNFAFDISRLCFDHPSPAWVTGPKLLAAACALRTSIQ